MDPNQIQNRKQVGFQRILEMHSKCCHDKKEIQLTEKDALHSKHIRFDCVEGFECQEQLLKQSSVR